MPGLQFGHREGFVGVGGHFGQLLRSRVEEEKTIQEDTYMPIGLFNVFQ